MEKNTNEKLEDIENNTNATKKITTLSYAIKNFSNAPPIKKLGGKDLNGLLYFKKKKRKGFALEHEFIHQYKHKTLHQFLGKLIISEYKPDNPENQGLWSSDLARLTFVIRKPVDNSATWVVDKKGVNITKLIISPMTFRTKEILQEFIGNSGVSQRPPSPIKCMSIKRIGKPVYDVIDSETSDESSVTSDEEEIDIRSCDSGESIYRNDDKTRLKSMQDALEVVMEINLDKLNKHILKYIAPYFGLEMIDKLADEDNIDQKEVQKNKYKPYFNNDYDSDDSNVSTEDSIMY